MAVAISIMSLNHYLLYSVLLAQIFLVLRYISSQIAFRKAILSHQAGRAVAPPTVPHVFPWIGNAFQFFLSPVALLARVTRVYLGGKQTPVHLLLGPQQLYVVQGAKNIRTLWKSSSLSTNGTFYYALRFFFAMPDKAAKRYLFDDSGTGVEPHHNSQVAPNNRVGFINHNLFSTFLVGPGYQPLCNRFDKELVRFRSTISQSQTWNRKSNLMELFTIDLTTSSLRAICGPTLLQLDPDFPRRFWEYSGGLPYFLRRVPRWLAPRSHGIRDSLIQSVARWHQEARRQFTPECVEADGDADPFWGCAFFRNRQERLRKIDGYNDEALACEDFAAIWGFHHNVILAVFWVAYEVYRDPDLLRRFRVEIASCRNNEYPSGFDADRLVKLPLLQSIWAETLRLRVHIFNTRKTGGEDLGINGWIIPKQSVAFVSSTPAHLDPTEWNEGLNDAHPVDTFWADRFLVYPGDPSSGPKRCESRAQSKNREGDGKAPYFLLDSSMSGAWIPFGGGGYTCPGRHFAKREALLTCAVMAASVDIEIEDQDKQIQMDWSTCGFGTLKPKKPVAFKIRQTRVESPV